MNGGDVKEKKNNRFLVVILVILCVVALIMVVAIVMINIKSDTGDEKIDEAAVVLPEELMGDDLSAEDRVIKETTLMMNDPNVSEEEIIAYYDGEIRAALNDNDTGLAINIIIQKMDFLVIVMEDCDAAKEYINSVDLSSYSEDEKGYLASYVISMAGECEDQGLQDYWRDYYEKWGTI